jgi:hypothetical protein
MVKLRAAVILEVGGPEVFELEISPVPRPKTEEVGRIRGLAQNLPKTSAGGSI